MTWLLLRSLTLSATVGRRVDSTKRVAQLTAGLCPTVSVSSKVCCCSVRTAMLCLASPSCTSPSALCRQTRLLFGGSADGRGEICRRRVLSTGSTGLGQCARRRSRIQVASCSRHALCVVASATSERVHVDASPFEGAPYCTACSHNISIVAILLTVPPCYQDCTSAR